MLLTVYSRGIGTTCTLIGNNTAFINHKLQTQLLSSLDTPKACLSSVHGIQKAILVLVLLVDGGEDGRGGLQGPVDVNNQGLLLTQIHVFAESVGKLGDGQVSGDQELGALQLG